MKHLFSCIKLIVFCFLFWGSVIGAFAQSGSAGSFSRIGFGPRGMAMGNALTSVTSEGIFSYYNPALAAHAPEGNQIDFATAAMSFDRSYHALNGTFHLPPSGGVTLSLLNANVANIDGRTIDGYHSGNLSTHQYQLATAMGQQIGENLSVGIGLKYYIADLHTNMESAKTLGLDLGLLYSFSDRLKAGATIQDLLASYNWDSSTLYGGNASGRVDPFPRRIRLGISYRILPNLLLSLQGGRLDHEDGSRNNLQIGSAYQIHERITLRAGLQVEELSSPKSSSHGSAGFSIHLPFDFLAPSVDYAFIQEANNISYIHNFGLQLNL